MPDSLTSSNLVLPFLMGLPALPMPGGICFTLTMHRGVRRPRPCGRGGEKSFRAVPLQHTLILAVYLALFRVGSGADLAPPSGLFLAETIRLKSGTQIETNHYSEEYHRMITTLTFMSMLLGAVALISILAHMVPAGGGSGRDNFNYRIPPSWSPENDNHYSFRAYMTDISLWVMLTDLQPHQQCAAITMRLAGSAREMARMITPQEMMFGGVRNGVAMDPVTYMLGALQTRFAALEEETRLSSMT